MIEVAERISRHAVMLTGAAEPLNRPVPLTMSSNLLRLKNDVDSAHQARQLACSIADVGARTEEAKRFR